MPFLAILQSAIILFNKYVRIMKILGIIRKKISFCFSISICKYIYYNFLSSKVKRVGKGHLIPYKGAVIDIAPNARINLINGDLEVGFNKLRKSKAETYIRLRNNAVWNLSDTCNISYGATVELLDSAIIESNYFTVNSNSVIVIAKKLTVGNDVMIGRNVTIYDSDFHPINNGDFENYTIPITIGNHVWIASNSTILKGVQISDGSVVASNSVIVRNIDDNQLVGNDVKQKIIKNNIEWRRY